MEKGVIKCPIGKTVPIQPLAAPCSLGLTERDKIVTLPGLISPEPKPNITKDIYKLDIDVELAKNK